VTPSGRGYVTLTSANSMSLRSPGLCRTPVCVVVHATRPDQPRCSSSNMETGPRSRIRQCGPGCGAYSEFPHQQRHIMWRPLHVHLTAFTDQPPFAVGMADRTARRGRPPNRAQSRSNRRRRCSGNASRRGSAAATLSASLLIAAEGPWLSWRASPGFGPLPENRDAKDSEMPYARDPQ
jgi:hypothetical protein